MFIPKQLLPPNCLYTWDGTNCQVPLITFKAESKTLDCIIDTDPLMCFLFACRRACYGGSDSMMYPMYEHKMFARVVRGIQADMASARRTVSTIIDAALQEAVTAPYRKQHAATRITADVVCFLATRDEEWVSEYMAVATGWYPFELLKYTRNRVLLDDTLLCSAINAAAPRGSMRELMYISNIRDPQLSAEIAGWMGVNMPLEESHLTVHAAVQLHGST